MQQATLDPVPDLELSFWQKPLGYVHALVVVGVAFFVGLCMHRFIGYNLVWTPAALSIMTSGPLLFMLIAGRVMRTHRVISWLSGIPFAVVVSAGAAVMAVIGGVMPLTQFQRLGAPSMWASWPFLMLMFLLMLNLAGAVGKRCVPINYTNILFFISHAGLALAIGGGAISSLMLERRTLVLFEGIPNSKAYDTSEREYALPFEATLRSFNLETFAPTLGIARLDSKEKSGYKLTPGSAFVKAGTRLTVDGVKVSVKRFFPRAVMAGEYWKEVPWKSGAPAAEVTVSLPSGKSVNGWVSSGSVETGNALLRLDDTSALVMLEPRPKRFCSDIDIKMQGKSRRVSVEVNKPVHVAGYELYQLSYDQKLGAASTYSVIELVKDRGIGVVYLGIYMLLAAAALHLWNGVREEQ